MEAHICQVEECIDYVNPLWSPSQPRKPMLDIAFPGHCPALNYVLLNWNENGREIKSKYITSLQQSGTAIVIHFKFVFYTRTSLWSTGNLQSSHGCRTLFTHQFHFSTWRHSGLKLVLQSFFWPCPVGMFSLLFYKRT
jgi:hypothetical protein